MAKDNTAEADDLEALQTAASQHRTDEEQPPEQGGDAGDGEDVSDDGFDLTDMIESDFGEVFGSPEGSTAETPTSPGQAVAPDADADADDDAQPPGEEARGTEPEPEPEGTETSQEPSTGLTREALLEQLVTANAELAKLRAGEAEAPNAGQEQVTDSQSPSLEETRAAAVEYLQNETYAMSQEDADLVLTRPEAVVPRLMANMHTHILEQVAQMVRASVPNIIHSLSQREQTQKSWEENFYGKWPALKAHAEEVNTFRARLQPAYKDEAKLVEELGAFLSLRHGIVPGGTDKPTSPTPARGPQPRKPPGRGPTQQGRPGGQEKSFFEQLAEEDLAGDS